MEIDERLIKQLADMFSVQNQIAKEEDIERRIDKIYAIYDEMKEDSRCGPDPWANDYMEPIREAYAVVARKLFIVKGLIDIVKEKITYARLAPGYLEAVNKRIEDVESIYSSWKKDCVSMFRGHTRDCEYISKL